MSARLVSMLERGARFLLNRRGFASRTIGTSAGPVHVYDAPGRGAAHALGRFGAEDIALATDGLKKALNDTDAEVRRYAAEALLVAPR